MCSKSKKWLSYSGVLFCYVFLERISFFMGMICERMHNCILSFSDVWLFPSTNFLSREICFFIRCEIGDQEIISVLQAPKDIVPNKLICGSALSSIFGFLDIFLFISILLMLLYLNRFKIIYTYLTFYFMIYVFLFFYILYVFAPFLIPSCSLLGANGNEVCIYDTQLSFWNFAYSVCNCSIVLKSLVFVPLFMGLLLIKKKWKRRTCVKPSTDANA